MTNEILVQQFDQDFITVSGTATTTTVNTSARTNGFRENATDLVNDEVKYTRWFDKSGTYKVKYVYARSLDGGIIDIAIDSAAGNNLFDGVNQQAAADFNNTIETTKDIARGFHDISILAQADGGTSDFRFPFQFMQFDLIDEHPVLGESAPAIQQPPHSFSNDNVSATPTKAEFQTAFGIPTSLPDGWIGILDDAGTATTVYVVTVINGEFFFEAMTKAI